MTDSNSDENHPGMVKSREIVIKMSDGSTIKGQIELNGYCGSGVEGVSDFFLNSTDQFIVVFNTSASVSKKTILINKSHVVWAVPSEESSRLRTIGPLEQEIRG